MEVTQEQKMYAQVVQKAWEDAEFKAHLMANPIDAIEQLTGYTLNLSEGQKFVVADQTDKSTIYLNIPQKIDAENLELTDEQLEMVAGGTDVLFWGGVTLGAAFAAAVIAGSQSK
ncbi:hypothetical protein GCM10023187_45030 [Nibrella viscosa]|uniref:Uncharacterized protein n=1 Tax=Nibrella viscosa TaxID=1084524 RepID=A0ABP8KSI9_9BACT